MSTTDSYAGDAASRPPPGEALYPTPGRAHRAPLHPWWMILPCLLIAGMAATAAVTHSKPAAMLLLLLMALPGGLFFMRHPLAIFWVLVVTAPLTDHLSLSLGGMNIRPYNALASLGIAWLFWVWAARRKTASQRIAVWLLPLFLPLILYGCSKIVTVAVLDHFPPGMSRIAPLKFAIFSGLLYVTAFVTAFLIDTPQRLHQALRVWLHIANAILLLGFIQIILSNTLGFHYVHHRDVIFFGRPYSVFREPDVLGSFFAATVFSILPLVTAKVPLADRRYMWVSLAAHSFFLLILLVRAAWLAAMCGAAVWMLSLIRSRYLGRAIPYLNRIALAALLGLMIFPIAAPSVAGKMIGRFASLGSPKGESASEYRLLELNAMVEYAMPRGSSPEQVVRVLFGHGDFSWGYWGIELLGRNYAQEAYHLAKKGIYMAHPGYCMFLSIWFDNGFVGLALYTAFFVVVAVRYFRTLGTVRPENRPLLMATTIPCVCVLTCFQFSYDPISPFLWVMIGFSLATMYHATRPGAEPLIPGTPAPEFSPAQSPG